RIPKGRMGLVIRGAIITQDFDLANAVISAPLALVQSRFVGDVNLVNARTNKFLGFSDSVIENRFLAPNFSTPYDLNLQGTVLKQGIDLSGLTILGQLNLSGAQVDGPVLADSLQARHLFLDQSRIEGEVIISAAKIDGQLLLDNARLKKGLNAQ